MKNNPLNNTAETFLSTPLGRLRIAASSRGIAQMDFSEESSRPPAGRPPVPWRAPAQAHPSAVAERRAARRHLARAIRQIRQYFAGRRSDFDLPLDLRGTPHQQRVWQQLRGNPLR